jgi:hypothetical protein
VGTGQREFDMDMQVLGFQKNYYAKPERRAYKEKRIYST